MADADIKRAFSMGCSGCGPEGVGKGWLSQQEVARGTPSRCRRESLGRVAREDVCRSGKECLRLRLEGRTGHAAAGVARTVPTGKPLYRLGSGDIMEREQNWKVGVGTGQGARKSSLDDRATRLHAAEWPGQEGRRGGRRPPASPVCGHVTPVSTSAPTSPGPLPQVEKTPHLPFRRSQAIALRAYLRVRETAPSPDPAAGPINSRRFCSLH